MPMADTARSKGPADGLAPRGVREVAANIFAGRKARRKMFACAIEHLLREVLQGDLGPRERLQDGVGHGAVSRRDIQDTQPSIGREAGKGHHLVQHRPPFILSADVLGDPLVHVAEGMPVVVISRSPVFGDRHRMNPPVMGSVNGPRSVPGGRNSARRASSAIVHQGHPCKAGGTRLHAHHLHASPLRLRSSAPLQGNHCR